MKKKRKNKGITLIALIITIIVLLILAGVTMSFVVGDNGVVTQAQKSRIRTDKESAEEEVKLEVAGSYDDEGNLDLELLNENLMKNFKGLKLKDKKTGKYNDFDNDKIKIENLPVTVYYKQTEVTINDKQLISNVAKDVENYGMYVDYPIDLSGDGNITNDWKIFYEDETGRVFLIAADYVPNSNKELQIAQGITGSETTGTTRAKMTTNGVCCSSWKASNAEYHCNDGYNKTLNQEKAQCSFPEIFMLAREDNKDEHTNNHYYCSKHTDNDNSKCASALQCTENWKSFVNNSYADYAIGGPTLEMWVASWNQKYGEEKDAEGNVTKKGITLFVNGNNDNTDKNGYYVGTDKSCTSNSQSISSCTDGYKDKLYFPHKGTEENFDLFEDGYNATKNIEGSDTASCDGYRLATPSASEKNSKFLMCIECHGYIYLWACVNATDGPGGYPTNFFPSHVRSSPYSSFKIWSLC